MSVLWLLAVLTTVSLSGSVYLKLKGKRPLSPLGLTGEQRRLNCNYDGSRAMKLSIMMLSVF